MIRINKYISLFFAASLLLFVGCQQDDYTMGELITPSNVDFTYEIIGADDENPNGDGSGFVHFFATADDEITFKYIYGDGKDAEIVASGDSAIHQFSINGLNTYNVTVVAVGTGGISSSKTTQIDVLSTFSDEEAVEFLTGGSSQKWYWAADQPGNIGLGPNDKAYDGGEHTWASWFNSNPWHADKLCMYDAEFIFTKTSDGLTFEQTAGSAYIPGDHAAKMGVDGNTCHGEDVVPSLYGVKNVSFSPSSSIATIDGGYRGTTMSFSDGGFMCWYVGTSTFEIIKLTENILKIRIEEGGNAWYCMYSTVKPEQP